MLDSHQSVARIVLDHSECAAVFHRYRIDFCCRGELSLEVACRERGVDELRMRSELEAAIANRSSAIDADPRTLSTPALVERIISTHHRYLREALPFVRTLAAKVSRVHGDHNPLLRELDVVVRELSERLERQADRQEHALFPAMLEAPPSSDVEPALREMRDEHLVVGTLLERMRNATEDYRLPTWACNSYRTLFAELEGLEKDVLRHVHLENHVLQPRFVSA